MQPDQDRAVFTEKRQISGLRSCATAKREDAGLLLFGGFPDGANELIEFDAAEFGFAYTGENFGDFQTGGVLDALIEIHARPSDLASQQGGRSGLAAAHESGEAHKSGGANLVYHLIRSELRCAVTQSIALEDIDCTIE